MDKRKSVLNVVLLRPLKLDRHIIVEQYLQRNISIDLCQGLMAGVIVSITSRIILLIAALIVRRLLIRYIGNDVNGLNSLLFLPA